MIWVNSLFFVVMLGWSIFGPSLGFVAGRWSVK
jgi:hypothetical protein